ncbi:MAG: twin-arginine translocase subunit TatC [Deltaproteobacteria bacterium]|nr:twin-arginine translocase subunit TatC [Deltaproteobacteria bacterium]
MSEEKSSLVSHLEELRKRLKLISIAVVAGFLLCYASKDWIFKVLTKPLTEVLPQGQTLVFTSLPEAFIVYIKISFFASIILTSPFIFFQIWKFVAPGLEEKEKKAILPFVFFSTVLFLSGIVFCYFFALPPAFSFFMGFVSEYLAPMLTFREYLSFTLKLLLGFGICFELPVLIYFLTKLGVLNYEKLARNRRYAILVIFIVAAIVTPSPDAITQLIMAIPMYLLYEVSVFMAWISQKKKSREENSREE